MKSKHLILSATALGLAFFTSSCDKVKDALFVAFNANSASVEFTIPVITDTTAKSDMGNVKNTFNIDSIIKEETNGQFSLSDIKKITIEAAQLEIINPDNENNFANFEEGWLTFSSDSKPTPVVIATGPNPDAYSSTWVLPPVGDVNLKEYLSGTELYYMISGKARRATNKTLDCKLNVTFHIE